MGDVLSSITEGGRSGTCAEIGILVLDLGANVLDGIVATRHAGSVGSSATDQCCTSGSAFTAYGCDDASCSETSMLLPDMNSDDRLEMVSRRINCVECWYWQLRPEGCGCWPKRALSSQSDGGDGGHGQCMTPTATLLCFALFRARILDPYFWGLIFLICFRICFTKRPTLLASRLCFD